MNAILPAARAAPTACRPNLMTRAVLSAERRGDFEQACELRHRAAAAGAPVRFRHVAVEDALMRLSRETRR
jgi:hypothetical protein